MDRNHLGSAIVLFKVFKCGIFSDVFAHIYLYATYLLDRMIPALLHI